MSVSEELQAAVAPSWDAAVRHRFVDELLAGTVEDAVLRRYLVQDHQFVDGFLALLGSAVASADRSDARLTLARQLGLLAGPENTYFQQAFDALGVPHAERDAAPGGVTAEFVGLMAGARDSGSYPQQLAVLTVAEWLYLDWASRAPDRLPPRPEHRDWILLHDNAEFRTWVLFLRSELDRTGPAQRRRCAELFGRATELELAFFEAAYG